jgi:EAL domain-containing protein (putative c-di-GMP-specific phosphodiesterase class I)
MPSYLVLPQEPPDLEGQPSRYRLNQTRRDMAAERRRLERDLSAAAREGRFALHYQPRVTLATDRTCAAEALLRWPHRKLGMIAPSVFIPIAERGGQIIPIGGWALRSACREAQRWHASLTVSVNVSARQLAAGVLLGQVAAALEESGLPPERLELELTESLLIDVDTDTLLALSALRDLGVGLALDDFGTGYASLSALKRLPLTAIKLDRSLIRDLPGEREDTAIVRAAIATGHALGLAVVAEGIETDLQRAFLAECGCDEGQGHLFSRPVPPELLPAWLE